MDWSYTTCHAMHVAYHVTTCRASSSIDPQCLVSYTVGTRVVGRHRQCIPDPGPRKDVALRSLRRYIGIAQGQAAKSTGAEHASATYHAKVLQVIESGIKLHTTWTSRSDISSGATAFIKQWASLSHFCQQAPVVEIESQHIWGLYYTVKSSGTNLPASHSLARGLHISGSRATSHPCHVLRALSHDIAFSLSILTTACASSHHVRL
jgi:hypothetical protein